MGQPGAGATILIVDDEEGVRTALSRQLLRLGFQVEQARDGAEGLAVASATRPEAVLLDLRMPGMDGHTFLRSLQAAGAHAPVVVMSGAGTMDDVIEVLRAGAVDFIRKPWTRDELSGAITRALGPRSIHGPAPTGVAPAPSRDFQLLLKEFDPETLATDPAVIIGVWPDLTIGFFNPAYLTFAAENGAPDIARKYGIGGSLAAALPDPVKGYYVDHLGRVLASGLPWEHDYTCDSPALERSYRLMAMPLGKEGLLLVHSLRVMNARGGVAQALVEEDYRDPGGKLVQCCQCRRLRRARNLLQWDFVPAALTAELQPDISHGLCHPCLSFYYSN